jgi:hypothetical protein
VAGRWALGQLRWTNRRNSCTDLIGGDDAYKRPGHSTFLEPGLAIVQGKGTFTLSVPLRVYGEFKMNPNDLNGGPPPLGNQRDLAKYLVFMGYKRRF